MNGSQEEQKQPNGRAAVTYYVDAKAGSDENSGLSEAEPFRTLDRISEEQLLPGDQVLFCKGRTYHGSLTICARGEAAAPVTVGAYGEGTRPVIAGKGVAAVVIRAVHFTLTGLEITNPDGRYGIRILPLHSGENRGVTVADCYIHDVDLDEDDGWGGYVGSGGIIARADGEEPVWFQDLVLRDNVIRRTSRMGITISNSWGWRYHGGSYIRNDFVDDTHGWWPNRNCRVIGNTVDGTKGDAILVQCGKDTLIERNTVYNANSSTKEHAKIAMVAIWTICTVDTVMQYNEVGYTKRPGADGEAFDTDHAEVNCTIRYNYSHHNEGGFVLLCNGMPGTARGATVCYNLSVADGGSADGACIQFIGGVADARIENNTFWLSAATRIMDVWRDHAQSTHIAGNIFAAPAGRQPAYTARPDPRPGGSVTDTDLCRAVNGFVFENNLFHHVPLPPVGGGVEASGNREADPMFSPDDLTEADYRDKEKVLAAFTPQNPVAGAPFVPGGGERDILGREITAGFYGCIAYPR